MLIIMGWIHKFKFDLSLFCIDLRGSYYLNNTASLQLSLKEREEEEKRKEGEEKEKGEEA